MLNIKSFKKTVKKLFAKRNKTINISLFACIFTLIFLVPFLIYNLTFTNLISPNVSIANIGVGALTISEATEKLKQQIVTTENISFTSQEKIFNLSTKNIDLKYDFDKSVLAAYNVHRTGNILYDFGQRINSLFNKTIIGLRVSFDEEKLNIELAKIGKQVGISAIYPNVTLKGKDIIVQKGSSGKYLDNKMLRIQIGSSFSLNDNKPIQLSLKIVDPTLTDDESDEFKHRAEKLINKSLLLKFEYQEFISKGNDLLALLDAKNEYNKEKINEWVEKIALQINRVPQDSLFVFDEGKVQEFSPSKDGIVLQQSKLNEMILGNLRTIESGEENQVIIDLPVNKAAPKIKTNEVNNLGIKELIGRGSSEFLGSIPNRIYNIKFASSKFKGVLIAPGETLSFNQTVGDISELTGFKQAYVIKEGKTILGDGGGVCQVSSTLFRAALNAGLPILERQAHAYRVGYYEQDSPPGLDATVYAPSPDLKIKNDTPGHILIQLIFDPIKLTLIFEIYGTSDGRISTISKPAVANIVPAPEDLYVDDPSLPAGKVKQIDYKAAGAKVTFKYSVERNGEIIYQKTFISNYRPWQAVYLKGTGASQ